MFVDARRKIKAVVFIVILSDGEIQRAQQDARFYSGNSFKPNDSAEPPRGVHDCLRVVTTNINFENYLMLHGETIKARMIILVGQEHTQNLLRLIEALHDHPSLQAQARHTIEQMESLITDKQLLAQAETFVGVLKAMVAETNLQEYAKCVAKQVIAIMVTSNFQNERKAFAKHFELMKMDPYSYEQRVRDCITRRAQGFADALLDKLVDNAVVDLLDWALKDQSKEVTHVNSPMLSRTVSPTLTRRQSLQWSRVASEDETTTTLPPTVPRQPGLFEKMSSYVSRATEKVRQYFHKPTENEKLTEALKKLEEGCGLDRQDDSVVIHDVVVQGQVLQLKEVHSIQPVWNAKMTVAFWAAIYFVNGAILFLVGSIALYPGVCPSEDYSKRWCEYPFVVGAWCFTLANYLIYFQAINPLNIHGTPVESENATSTMSTSTRFLLPRRAHLSDMGYWACACNLLGGLFYNLNTMGSFGNYEKSIVGYDLGYILTGCVGSALFIMAAALEGEYNHWRSLSRETFNKWPVLSAYSNFVGSVLYFMGYIVDNNKWITNTVPVALKARRTAWLVASPFTIGSACFLMAAWAAQTMWKKHMYGLGFVKDLSETSYNGTVSVAQQSMLMVFCLNLCISYVTLGEIIGRATPDWYKGWHIKLWLAWDALLRIAGYNCIIGFASVLHSAPREDPYRILYWVIQIGTIFDLVGQMLWLGLDNKKLFSR